MRACGWNVVYGLLLWCGVALAQVRIYVDPSLPDRDTVDFGYVLVGDTVLRGLTIENNLPFAVSIPAGIRPYMWLEPVPLFNQNDPDEFPLEALFPFLVPSGQQRVYPLRYTATQFAAEHPEGRHQVALTVSVRRSDDTSTEIVQRRFLLRVTKSFRPLWSDQASIGFDSVYVQPQLVRTLPILLRNVSKESLLASVRIEGDTASRLGFSVDVEPSEYFAAAQVKQYPVRFAPQRMGEHVVDVRFIHPSVVRRGEFDTTTVQLRGMAVEQRMEVATVQGRDIVRWQDTITLRHRRIGATDTVAIVFENLGNVPIGIVETALDGPASSFLSVVRELRRDRSLQLYTYDTLVLAVRPTQAGTFSATIEIRTDLRSRSIWGIPPEAGSYRFVVVVESDSQRIVPLQNELHWGEVLVLGNCTDAITDTLRLVNRSSIPHQLTSLEVPPPFTVALRPPVDIPPQSELVIPIGVRSALDTGSVYTMLQIETTDKAYSPLLIPLFVRLVSAQPPQLRIPTTEYVPGVESLVPVLCDSIATLYSQLRFVAVLDPTMAELIGIGTAGTAAQNAAATFVQRAPGVFEVNVQSPLRLLRSDTLLQLRLRTYLGEASSSLVHIDQVRVGTALCPNAMAGHSSQAELRVAPFCGMNRIFPVVLPSVVIMDVLGVGDGTLRMRCWARSAQSVVLELYATDGRRLRDWHVPLHAGTQEILLPSNVGSGIYALRMQTSSTAEAMHRVVLLP